MVTKISQSLLFHDRHCHKISKFQEHKKFRVQFADWRQWRPRFAPRTHHVAFLLDRAPMGYTFLCYVSPSASPIIRGMDSKPVCDGSPKKQAYSLFPLQELNSVKD
jgi:hypothetical protein